MKPIVKSNKNVKNMNLSYYEEIANFLSDNFIFNKKNLMNFYVKLYKLDNTVRFDKLKIKYSGIMFYHEGEFNIKPKRFKVLKFITINKEILKRFNNVNFAKPYALSVFMHEMHHKKQFDNLFFNRLYDAKEKNEIDKVLFFELFMSTINKVYPQLNRTPLSEVLARMETLDDYVKMLKNGTIKPTIENLIAILPSSLQTYSMTHNSMDNNILFIKKDNAELNFAHFENLYRTQYEVFEEVIDCMPLPPNKREEMQTINFDKFHYELKEKSRHFDDNICYVYNQLLTLHNVPIVYKEIATNLEYLTQKYLYKYIGKQTNEEVNEKNANN